MVLEIILILVLIALSAIGLGRHKRRRNTDFSNYIPGQIDLQIALTTLAANTGVRVAVTGTVDDTTRVSSIRCTYSLANFTPTADAGPILAVVAHSDYSLAEIEEYLENTSGWGNADLVGQERVDRRIRRIGVFPTARDAVGISVLNDGRPIKTKLNWKLMPGQTLAFVGYNMGTAAIATTVPDVHVMGKANLWSQ